MRRAHRRRGAPDRRRGRGPLPRRARRDAAVGPARRVPRGRARTSLRQLVLRFARGRGPFTTAEANERFGRDVEPRAARARARGAARPRRAAPGRHRARVVRPGRAAPAAPRVARRAAPRGRAGRAGGARALPARAGTGSTGARRCARRSCRCRRCRCRSRSGSREVLPRRVPGYRPEQLDQLCATGEVVWVGAGLDRVAVYFREDAPVLGRSPARRAPEGEAHDAIRAALGRGALFWLDLLDATGLDAEEALPALWDLVWAGEVTNDAWTPLRAGAPLRRAEARAAAAPLLAPPRERGRRRRRAAGRSTDAPLRRARPTGARSPSCCSSGRASSRATASAPRASPAATAPSTASCARSRRSASAAAATSSRGSAARSSRSAARSSGCASSAARRARSRRRSCSPRPTRRSRTARRCRGRSAPGARAARVAGAHVVLLGGEAALFVERGGRSLVPLREPDEEWLRPALAALVAHVRARRREAPRGRALRRRAGRRDRRDAAARRGRLPRRPAPRRAAAVS